MCFLDSTGTSDTVRALVCMRHRWSRKPITRVREASCMRHVGEQHALQAEVRVWQHPWANDQVDHRSKDEKQSSEQRVWQAYGLFPTAEQARAEVPAQHALSILCHAQGVLVARMRRRPGVLTVLERVAVVRDITLFYIAK